MFAVPAELMEAEVPKPTEGPQDVPGALEHFMLGLDGDDSAWSYLTASFLSRDADELGAYSTGARFCNQTLLTSCPSIMVEDREPQSLLSRLTGFMKKSKKESRDWEWQEPRPECWWPEVQLGPDQVVVVFYLPAGMLPSPGHHRERG